MREIKRIPFDSLVLSAVTRELSVLVGGQVQHVAQPNPQTVVISVYSARKQRHLLLSCDASFARAHLVSGRPRASGEPLQFCAALRSRLDGSRFGAVRQVGFDRILEIEFDGPKGRHRLVAELMGKHSNLLLLEADERVISAAKWIGPGKSSRPISPGRPYERPPFPPRRSIFEVASDKWGDAEGASPFLVLLLESEGRRELSWLRDAVDSGSYRPVESPGLGAYPISVAPLGLAENPVSSLSSALERHYSDLESSQGLERDRRALLAQLRRVLLARDAALLDLAAAADAASRAADLQRKAELILTFGPSAPEGAGSIRAVDYDGTELEIRVDPELTYVENAGRMFARAKRAKSSSGEVLEQASRLSKDREALREAVLEAEAARSTDALGAVRALARNKRWIGVQSQRPGSPSQPKHEGHKVRELLGPGGLVVLYGENATSNDYLTQRIAKPNDYWLHVRGSSSAHVVIQTGNKPEKVTREALQFAAAVAARNSASKHSGFVPVDFTLRKYVRKPRGSAPGAVTYTHEKTLHVEP